MLWSNYRLQHVVSIVKHIFYQKLPLDIICFRPACPFSPLDLPLDPLVDIQIFVFQIDQLQQFLIRQRPFRVVKLCVCNTVNKFLSVIFFRECDHCNGCFCIGIFLFVLFRPLFITGLLLRCQVTAVPSPDIHRRRRKHCIQFIDFRI